MQNDKKVILINGVNVAGCEFYLQDEKYSCDLSFINQEELCKCDDVQDCTYKQLKRLEQENKELSFAIEKCLENAGIECDDEEQALRSLPMLGNAHYKVLVEKEALEQENKELKAETLQWKQIKDMANNNKYRSALEEIREIVRADCKGCTAECDCNDDCTRYMIKHRINEVLK